MEVNSTSREMKMALDPEYIKQGLEKARSSFYMYIPIMELTRDELIAVLIEGWELEKKARQASYERDTRSTEFMERIAADFRNKAKAGQSVQVMNQWIR